MRISDWSSDVCSSDLVPRGRVLRDEQLFDIAAHRPTNEEELARSRGVSRDLARGRIGKAVLETIAGALALPHSALPKPPPKQEPLNGNRPLMDLLKVMLKLRCEAHAVAQKRSEEHPYELQSLLRTSYAVFRL